MPAYNHFSLRANLGKNNRERADFMQIPLIHQIAIPNIPVIQYQVYASAHHTSTYHGEVINYISLTKVL